MSFLKQNSVGLGTTTTTGRNAGVGTAIGEVIYNATDDRMQMYTPAGWVNVAGIPFAATGGDIVDDSSISGYKVHIFTGDGDFTVQSGEASVNYAIVAGGGGGTGGVSGGSGGGGYRTGTGFPVTPGPYPVTVGGGGASQTDGQPSQFSTIHVYGGGKGSASSGGCGGGANYNASGVPGLNPGTPAPIIAQFPLYVPGTTEGGNGGNGGPGVQNFGSGGGGGANGSTGGNGGASFAGPGAAGIQIPALLRTPQTGVQGGYVGGGGGGGTYQGGTQGSGGIGGGGAAQDNPGSANSGGGSGGSSNNTPNPGTGGSGLVVVSYEVV